METNSLPVIKKMDDASAMNAGRIVDVYDDEKLVGSAVVSEGQWKVNLEGLADGAHHYVAKSQTIESEPRDLTKLPALTIDVSEMVLDGYAVIADLTPTGNYPANNFRKRVASGGVEPYVYASDKPETASVETDGTVVGRLNGTANITVRDALGNSATYPVTVSHVYRLLETKGPYNFNEAMVWIGEQPGSIEVGRSLINRFVGIIRAMYIDEWATGMPHWYGLTGDTGPYGFVHTGGRSISAAGNVNQAGIRGAVCFVAS